MDILSKRKYKNRKGGSSLRYKGSLTAESAFVLPFFFLTITLLACILDLYRINMLIQTALCEGAKELGMYAYCTEEDSSSPVGAVTDAVCMAYGTEKVRNVLKGEALPGIQGGVNGIYLLGSGFQNETVTLKAFFFYSGPGGFFRFFPVKIHVEAQAQAWTGYHGNPGMPVSSENLVYITQWESVYHTSPACTHLALSISRVDKKGIEERANQYGEHYHPCEKCMESTSSQNFVYITRTGNRYHSTKNCSGLTRIITAVKESEAQGLNICTRCSSQN